MRPFTVAVSDGEIADLRERLARTRWPEKEVVDDWSQGAPLAYIQELCDYWATSYDWRRFEAEINAYDHFLTEIDGIDVHFMHVRSPHEDARPMIITHGWPGSVAEFMKIIDPLTNPTEHGGSADDAFHLVLPSMPGYGWSAKPTTAGTSTGKIAEMWDVLMVRLGYDSYVAQGGDWGAAVISAVAWRALGHSEAIHTNMPIGRPGSADMEKPSEVELAGLAALK
ncbi:MAG: alpha/beta fold hydrolase, partial [Actinobacteria bacterium]|nr:alpha/beta fold hydrolase [Actinomycetota bacterium]